MLEQFIVRNSSIMHWYQRLWEWFIYVQQATFGTSTPSCTFDEWVWSMACLLKNIRTCIIMQLFCHLMLLNKDGWRRRCINKLLLPSLYKVINRVEIGWLPCTSIIIILYVHALGPSSEFLGSYSTSYIIFMEIPKYFHLSCKNVTYQ